MLDEKNSNPTPEFMEDEQEKFYDVPQVFNVFQYICLGVLYLVAAFLLGFIIYISATWNKVRINEYT